MTQPHSVEPEPDPRPARLGALSIALHAHHFAVELDGDLLKVSSPNRPGHEVSVRCSPRASDDNRLWFEADGRPIVEADNITEALTTLKGMTAARM